MGKKTEKGIWYDEKGKRYRKRITYVQPLTGQKLQKIISASDCIELSVKINKFRKSIDLDGGDYSQLTVAEYLDIWLGKKKATKKPKTARNYEDACRLHIKPALGKALIQRLRKRHIQEFFNVLAKKLSPSSVASVRRIFRIALNDAVDEEIIERNPILRTDIPTVHKTLPVALEQDDMIRLFRLAYTGEFLLVPKSADSDYLKKQFFVALCVSMGSAVRRGELFGLTWDCVQGDTILIKNNLVEVAGKYILETPKTEESVRKIKLPVALSNLLLRWKDTQDEYARLLGDVYNNEKNLVFTNSVGHFVSGSNFYRRWWNPLRIASGLKNLKWHNIRSASCSYMASHGIDRRIVGQVAGHADTRTTETYYIGTVKSQDEKRLEVMQDWATQVIGDK